MAKAKIKMKYWKRPVEKKEELQEKQIQTKEELSKDFEAYCGKEAFENGFDIAKSMIIEFLSQKSLGYNDAYFFKMQDIEAIGEPDKISDETMTEKDRIAKWDWSEKMNPTSNSEEETLVRYPLHKDPWSVALKWSDYAPKNNPFLELLKEMEDKNG